MPDLLKICDDLAAEQDVVDGVVAQLDGEGWDIPTPAEGWSIRDQISHLAFFETQALAATSDPEAFVASLSDIARNVGAFLSGSIERGRASVPGEVLEWWRSARQASLESFRALEPTERVPWFGPAMTPASFVSARLMETWAHGQDIFDALGVERDATDRLRHIAHLGVRARSYSYSARGMVAPDEPVRVELTAPSGETWTWGDEARDRVTGPALDFCLVVTQRRHISDTDLIPQGPHATGWMSIAQCYAGPPGEGRKPGQFPRRSAR